MKQLRIVLLVLFIISAVVFGVFEKRRRDDEDFTSPVISVDKDIVEVSVTSSDEDFLQGVRAVDDRDGDVTSTLVVAAKSNFIEPGVIRVDYAAFDSHNNVGTFSRRARFTDYTHPRFSSEEPLVYVRGTDYDFRAIKATDSIDDDITNRMRFVYTTATASATEIEVYMEVTNQYGDLQSLSTTFEVYSNAEYQRYHPGLSEYLIYTPIGTPIDPYSYCVGTFRGGDLTPFDAYNQPVTLDDVRVDGTELNYSVPGIYKVYYTFDLWNIPESQQDRYGSSTLYVVVTED